MELFMLPRRVRPVIHTLSTPLATFINKIGVFQSKSQKPVRVL